MLDPWIIEEIIRREREEKSRHEQLRIELPLQKPAHEQTPSSSSEDKDRGVTTIDI